MDIRKFFSPPAKKDEDDFVKKKRKVHKRKGVLFDSGSSDEDPIPKTFRKKPDSPDIIIDSDENTKIKPKLTKGKRKQKKTPEKKLKEISPGEFFKNFKSTSTKAQTPKRKSSEVDRKASKVLKRDFDDEDFFIDEDLEEILADPKPQKKSQKGEVSGKLAALAVKQNSHKRHAKADNSEKKANRAKQVSSNNVKEEFEVKDNNESSVPTETASDETSLIKPNTKPSSTKAKNTKKGLTPSKTPTKSNTLDKSSAQADSGDAASAKQARFLKFHQWQHRSGPANPGSKEVPIGKSYCFEGMTFVITGVQESLSRDEIRSLVERYGGKVTTSVSSRTTYLITGSEAGESKLKKAEQHRTPVIDEDQFLDLIRTLPGKKSKYEVKDQTHSTSTEVILTKHRKSPKTYPVKQSSSEFNKSKENSQSSQESVKSLTASQKPESGKEDTCALMWVDKYKPKTIKQIIGQQGANSNVNKLLNWLKNWHMNNRHTDGKAKPKSNYWGGGDPTGASYKAALLSGAPGVGKTTTATLVCQELGFSYVELNASDRRSKTTLKEDVAASVQNTSISNLFGGEDSKSSHVGSQHALIMDEVDGMAGNEDRGGMQELIQIIKSTKIPIICMCNDRSSPKIRSLANYCFDLRFQRPRVEQITSAAMSICYKEGISVEAPAVQAIIRGCNQDIRQVFHTLSMIKANESSLSYDDAKKQADRMQKDVNLGIFEIARKLLSSESASMSLMDKSDLFFMDYSMVPKFVQENYIHVMPYAAKGNTRKQLQLLSKTADCIACGDLIESSMRHDQSWSMLPTLGFISTVIPCDYMRGGMQGMINFPSFFGKLSTTGKNHRLLQELKFHSSVNTSGCTEETFNLDLIPYLRWHFSQPLLRQSRGGEVEVHKVTKLLDDYDLTKEDFDNLMEVGQYPGKTNYVSQVDSKVKAAFTRTYNKESHLTPYAVASTAAKKRKAVSSTDLQGDDWDDSQIDEAEESDEDVGVDGMIKQAKKKTTAKNSSKPKTSKAAAASSKTKRSKK